MVLEAEHPAVRRSSGESGQGPTLDLFLQSLGSGQGGHQQRAEGQVTNSNAVEQVQLAAFMLVMQPGVSAARAAAISGNLCYFFSRSARGHLGWVHLRQERGATSGPARHWLQRVLQCSGRSTNEKGVSRKTSSPASNFSLVVTNLPLTLSPLSSGFSLGLAPISSASDQPSIWQSFTLKTSSFSCSSLQRVAASLLRASKSLQAPSRFSGVNFECLGNVKCEGSYDETILGRWSLVIP